MGSFVLRCHWLRRKLTWRRRRFDRYKKVAFLEVDAGKAQLVRPTDGRDRERVLLAIRRMEDYARRRMTEPSVSRETRRRCRNEFRMCAEWASRGMCRPPGYVQDEDEYDAGRDDVVFMMNNCPLACRMCEEIETFHKCAGRRHPWARASFQNGELHSFFENERTSSRIDGVGDESEWKKYDPLFVSYPDPKTEHAREDPYVVVFRKFLSDEEADRLVSLASKIGWAPKDASFQRARCHDRVECHDDEIHARILERTSSLVNATASHLEPMEFVRFDSEDRAAPHHHFETNGLWKPAGPRVLSLFLFLSDVHDERGGGGIGFPRLDWLFVRPKKGMAVLWPNVRNDDVWEMDPWMSVEHFPVGEGGTKYGAYLHVRLYNWTDANMRGCA